MSAEDVRADRAYLARALAEARARLLATVAVTDAELATLELRAPGGAGEDAASIVATAVLSRLQGRERHDLDEIEAAQARLAAGTYGVCERCAGTIPLPRLRAMPSTRFCVTCQTWLDVERRRGETGRLRS